MTEHTAQAPESRSALAQAVVEIERHVATGGWDGPVRVFALVRTAAALEAEPALAHQLPPEVLAAAAADPEHLTSVEQEGLPASDDLEGLLGAIAWPPTVDGAAVTVERVVLPPEAEDSLPDDPQEAVQALMAHPDRQDVRLAVGVLRDGSAWCAIRQRALDADQAVGQGPDAVPGLIEALRATLV
ncbi:PPA1309 family protein [Cellulomonas sp. NPDC089187]|uniref:PPA1309 family protein n=1 Tax=Cellulomonas sp. NPDC089187 TaxID=3154970 RepID=UPI003440FEB7